MSEIKITWLGLRNDREKTIWSDAFWTGVDAGEQMKEEVRKLAEDLGAQETVQRTLGETEESGNLDGCAGADRYPSGKMDAGVSENIGWLE